MLYLTLLLLWLTADLTLHGNTSICLGFIHFFKNGIPTKIEMFLQETELEDAFRS